MLEIYEIWLNLDHSKVIKSNLIMIFEGRFSHKSLLFDVTLYIESLQIIWNGIQYEPFYFLPF